MIPGQQGQRIANRSDHGRIRRSCRSFNWALGRGFFLLLLANCTNLSAKPCMAHQQQNPPSTAPITVDKEGKRRSIEEDGFGEPNYFMGYEMNNLNPRTNPIVPMIKKSNGARVPLGYKKLGEFGRGGTFGEGGEHRSGRQGGSGCTVNVNVKCET